MSSSRILVIEDNVDNLGLIKDMLQALSYSLVLQATDGEEGLEIAFREKPDLILLDLALPIVDGYKVAQTLKATPGFANIPIIALTAHAMIEDRKKAIDAGCDDYISKPINWQLLIEKLSRFAPQHS